MSKPPAPSDLADKFMLRMPEGLRERIKSAADSSNRSMNAEIVSTLEEKYPAPLTDKEIGLIEHFRRNVERYKVGDAKKDELISHIVMQEYLELMQRVSSIPEEDLNPTWAAADLHQRITRAMETRGLKKNPD